MASHLPYAPGVPSIGNDLMRYIPILFAGKTIKRYYETSIVPFISNTNYEGQIRKQGSEVVIRKVPEIAIEDHAIGDVVTNQRPLAESTTLVIDRAKRWSFIIEDIEQVQTDLKGRVAEWSANAAQNLDAHICVDFLNDVVNDPHADNQGDSAGAKSHQIDLGVHNTPVNLTPDNVMKKVVEAGAVLDEQNVPDEGRWLLIDPLTAALLKTSDIKAVQLTGDAKSPYRTGLVGRLDRFTVFSTNRLKRETGSKGQELNILFGNNEAITFATQLTKNKVVDDPNGFDMIYRGLQVYGFKTIRPEALGKIVATIDFAYQPTT